MANREFISAKDLPVTEAGEVNVLVVDPATGELAQKPSASIGGSGFEIPTAVFVSPSDDIYYAKRVYGDIEAIANALNNHMPVEIKLYKYDGDDLIECKTLSGLHTSIERDGELLIYMEDASYVWETRNIDYLNYIG